MKREIILTGEWQFKEHGRGPGRVRRWLDAEVPGTVHTDLLAQGLIEDPFYRLNELDLRWIEYADWVYQRTFTVPADDLRRARAAWLDFDGLDTFATVRLNGLEVGSADNMFHGWRFDAREAIRPGMNKLEVAFTSAARVGEERAARSKVRYKSSFFEERVFIRKAQYSGGWDWGPRLLTCGIWRPVRLTVVEQAEIRDVWAQVGSLTDRQAVLDVEIEIDSYVSGPANLQIELMEPGGRLIERSVTARLKRGLQTHRALVKVDRPLRWWPAGMGEQPLYQLQVTLAREGEVYDQHRDRIGLRTLELVRRRDKQGESFGFRVNGREFFSKGANWVPPDSFLPRFTPEQYRQRVADAREANMNMLRVWGGGVYEAPAFYDACDELGLLVWQDFMFACAEYPEDKPLLNSIRLEAAATVRRLRHHACLALWCGNNENQWGYDDWWKPRPERYGEVIYDDILPGVCETLDPTRTYWPGSPYGGPMANNPDFGDMHDWSVWIFWGNPEKYRESRGRFISEFGFQAMPCAMTVRSFTEPRDRHLFSRVLDHHNRCEDGHARNLKFLAHTLGVPRDLDEYIYLSQLSQADAIKLGVEHWRRRWPATAGALYWQHNDCWPVASWSALDWFGRPKALWYATRRFFAPLLLSVSPVGTAIHGRTDVEVWVSNDQPGNLSAVLETTAWTVDGKRLWQKARPVRVLANSSKALAKLAYDSMRLCEPDRELLHVRLLSGRELLAQTVHYFAPPKYVAWPDPGLRIRVRPDGERLRIEVQSRRAARAVALEADRWEGRFSDNWFDLVPGEERTLSWRPAGSPPPAAAFQRGLKVRHLVTRG